MHQAFCFSACNIDKLGWPGNEARARVENVVDRSAQAIYCLVYCGFVVSLSERDCLQDYNRVCNMHVCASMAHVSHLRSLYDLWSRARGRQAGAVCMTSSAWDWVTR